MTRSAIQQTRSGGFTLIEVMLSMAIAASMLSVLWGAFSLAARGRERGGQIADRYYQVRLSMTRMVREISMAYLSRNDLMGTINPRTFFVSSRNSRTDELTFSYLGHVRLHETAKESDQAVVRYFAAPSRDDRRVTNLMRRETRRLGAERPEEDGAAYVMLENVDALHFFFWDEQQEKWRETWSTKSADGQPDRLPARVRIELSIRDELDKPLKFTTETRVFMRDPISFSRTKSQTP